MSGIPTEYQFNGRWLTRNKIEEALSKPKHVYKDGLEFHGIAYNKDDIAVVRVKKVHLLVIHEDYGTRYFRYKNNKYILGGFYGGL